jgi:hypothetical protein
VARLKKDSSSWKAQGLKAKQEQTPEQPVPLHRQKNTRKWCKGHVGVLHDYQMTQCRRMFGWYKGDALWVKFCCSNCSKQLSQWVHRDA